MHFSKATLPVVSLCCAFATGLGILEAAEKSGKQPLIDCGNDKVILFEGAESKDGRYAVGWTIRPPNKTAKPVDWSLWDAEDNSKLLDRYVLEGDSNYDVINCVIDLPQKKILELPFDYWPDQNRRSLGVFWSSEISGRRYCLVQYEARFETEKLSLIKIEKSGMSQMDLVNRLEKVVRKTLQERMPFIFKKFAISYPESDWDDVGYAPAFHAISVDIPFTANLPKSSFDRVTGTVTVHLPEGNVMKVACDTPGDDPFYDDAKLAKADLELNAIYAELQKQLNPKELAVLKKEELEWIEKRNSIMGDYPLVGNEVNPSQFRKNRNEDLCKSTQERIAELQKFLKAKVGQ
jgi:uncharacterized protein YecT (DUF1311 family)